MEKIDFGVGISMPIKPNMRKKAERFLREVLGCVEILKNDSYTNFKFPNGQIIGITPDENAPTEEEYEKSIWLELVSEDFNATKKRIKEFNVREIPSKINNILFFNIPGGAVFRLISKKMTKNM